MEKNVYKWLCLSVTLLLFSHKGRSQVASSPLERTMSIELSGNSIKETFNIMEEHGGYVFAYRTDLINPQNRLTRQYREKTTREILDDIFQGSMSYKQKGNYIILHKKADSKSSEISIQGYVIDTETEQKVPYVSIFDTSSLSSAVSNEYGYYELRLKNQNQVYLTTRKMGYRDTSFTVKESSEHLFNVPLTPLVKKKPVLENQVDSNNNLANVKEDRFFGPFKLSNERKANILNFKSQLKRRVQVSVLPFVGTNGGLSASTSVDYSYNIFGGITGGVRKTEIAGLFNLVMDTVQGFQAAGIFNAVKGPQYGAQFAGFANVNGNTFEGAQFAGFTNVTAGATSGTQMAGFWNHSNKGKKLVQVAGFGNSLGTADTCVQMAGFINTAKEGLQGAQVAGFSNHILQDGKAVQLAGFTNTATGNLEGVQVAGFINIAKELRGHQISFINISDSISGIPFGFFSFSKKGYHQLEVSGNELYMVNLAFKTGTQHFYNTFMAGMEVTNTNKLLWGYGYGIGTSSKAFGKNRIFYDLQAMNLQYEGESANLRMLNKLAITLHVPFAKKMAVAFGPSLNVFIADHTLDPIQAEYLNVAPYVLEERITKNNISIQSWVGGVVALRFL